MWVSSTSPWRRTLSRKNFSRDACRGTCILPPPPASVLFNTFDITWYTEWVLLGNLKDVIFIPFSLPSSDPADFAVYKPFLILFGMVDGLQNALKVTMMTSPSVPSRNAFIFWPLFTISRLLVARVWTFGGNPYRTHGGSLEENRANSIKL